MGDTIEYAEDPLYRSETYYGVVIFAEKYLGWECTYCGDGRMDFQHDNGEQLSFDRGHDRGWMRQCWDAFLLEAQKENQNG